MKGRVGRQGKGGGRPESEWSGVGRGLGIKVLVGGVRGGVVSPQQSRGRSDGDAKVTRLQKVQFQGKDKTDKKTHKNGKQQKNIKTKIYKKEKENSQKLT